MNSGTSGKAQTLAALASIATVGVKIVESELAESPDDKELVDARSALKQLAIGLNAWANEQAWETSR